MVRVNRQTYAGYFIVPLREYRVIHGIIDEFGGKVKQFTQDIRDPSKWIIFYEMAKLQKVEFEESLKDIETTATV